MPTIIKSSSPMKTIDVSKVNTSIKPKPLVDRVTFFVDNSRKSNFELNKLDFQKNTLDKNKKYFIDNDDNPINKGLMTLDILSRGIKNGTFYGELNFVDYKIPTNPDTYKSLSLERANIITLEIMEMDSSVIEGLKRKLLLATAFNTLSLKITNDVKMGNSVFSKYKEETLSLGESVIKEWVYK